MNGAVAGAAGAAGAVRAPGVMAVVVQDNASTHTGCAVCAKVEQWQKPGIIPLLAT